MSIAAVRQVLRGFDYREFRARGAALAFKILGPNALSAIPTLTRAASVPPNPYWGHHDPAWGLECPESPSRLAIFGLANIGPAAAPSLLTLARNPSTNIQIDAVYLLSWMGTNALPAIPLLLQDIQNPANPVAAMAARTLGDLKLKPEIVIPALTNVMEKRSVILQCWTNGLMDPRMDFQYRALNCLAAYGPAARPALPVILNWLDDEDPFIPSWAADALGKLALEPKVVVPALTKALGSPNFYLVRSAARSLGAYGPAATPAVPNLLNLQNTHRAPACYAAGTALQLITNSVPPPISKMGNLHL